MSVTGYVGLPGSGKTLELVSQCVKARKKKREVFANFRLGGRTYGYIVPVCDNEFCGEFHSSSYHGAVDYRFLPEPVGADLLYIAKWFKWRRGRGFVQDPETTVLTSWEQIVNIRVMRDDFGRPHKTRLIQDSEGAWQNIRSCEVWNCDGCSTGITVAIDELNLWAPSRMWQELGMGVLNRWAYNRKDGLEILWTAQHEARVDKVAREVTDFIWNCRSIGGLLPLGKHASLRLQVFHRDKWIPALMTEANRTAPEEGVRRSGITDMSFGFYHQEIADAYDTYEHVAVNEELAATARGKVTSIRRPRARSAVGAGGSGGADLA